MTTSEIASKLVELCRQDKIDEVQATLFADHAKSIEANDSMGPRLVESLEGIKEKAKIFQASVEQVHGATISDPVVGGNSFALSWALDVTFKGAPRTTIDEICVYQVEDGKIVLEQFFY